MTSDCYAILGVAPTAEDVVIGAAYRALMRHYHPDTNSDPQAQARAQEISAAYAVLRDPAKRAEYDAQRGAGGILWGFDEAAEPPPPMRTAGIATALLAVVLVGAVWAWPRPSDAPRADAPTLNQPDRAKAPKADPVARREPAREPPVSAPPVAPPAPAPSVAEGPDIEPAVAPRPKPVQLAGAQPLPRAPRVVARPVPQQTPATPATPVAAKAQAEPAKPKPVANERVAALNRMSAGFFSQSMVHASKAKKQLLLAARDRLTAQRKACRSASCVADTYVREIRETSAIMEDRAGPK